MSRLLHTVHGQDRSPALVRTQDPGTPSPKEDTREEGTEHLDQAQSGLSEYIRSGGVLSSSPPSSETPPTQASTSRRRSREGKELSDPGNPIPWAMPIVIGR